MKAENPGSDRGQKQSRRDFLRLGKNIALGLAMRPLWSNFNLPSRGQQGETAKAVLQGESETYSKSFDYESVFNDPIAFLNSLEQTFRKKENPERFQTFFDAFGISSPSAEPSRAVLLQGLSVIRGELLNIIKTLDPVKTSLNVEGTFPMMGKYFLSPFSELDGIKTGRFSEDISKDICDDSVLALLELIDWMEPLATSTNEVEIQQKYQQRSDEALEKNEFWQKFDTYWDAKHRGLFSTNSEELGQDQATFTAKGKARVKKAISSLQDIYPRMLAGVGSIGFMDGDSDKAQAGRSSANWQNGSINMENTFFNQKKNDSNYNQDWAFRAMLHEFSHQYDLLKSRLEPFKWIDVRDFLQYVEGAIAPLEILSYMIEGEGGKEHLLTQKGIEYLFVHPWFQVGNANRFLLGIDQLESQADVNVFQNEMDNLNQILRTLDDDAMQPFLEESGMKEWFAPTGDTMLSWRTRGADETFNPYKLPQGEFSPIGWSNLIANRADLGRYEDGRFANLPMPHDLVCISHGQIQDITNTLSAIFSRWDEWKDDYDIQKLLQAFLEIKSQYMFAITVLYMKALKEPRSESLSTPANRIIYNSDVYDLVSNPTNRSVLSQIYHFMTGPLGEYTSLAGLDYMLPNNSQELVLAAADAKVLDKEDQLTAFLERGGDSVDHGQMVKARNFAGGLHHAALSIWRRREKMWGSEGADLFATFTAMKKDLNEDRPDWKTFFPN